MRPGWLKKGLDATSANPLIFSAEDAVAVLGVGKNMVRAIRHWCLAAGVLEEKEGRNGVGPTTFGRFLLDEADPYLERDGSSWLLHWRLVTNVRRASTWYWAFNVCREAEWTRETLQAGLMRWAEGQGWKRLAAASLKSDVAVFVRTYLPGRRGPASTPEEALECPLAALGLIAEAEDGKRYRFNGRPKATLPPAVFAFALTEFWQKGHAEAPALSLREITHGEGSPGRVFRLDEDGVLAYLDGLREMTGGRLTFVDTALTRQVARRVDVQEIDPMEYLRAYYHSV